MLPFLEGKEEYSVPGRGVPLFPLATRAVPPSALLSAYYFCVCIRRQYFFTLSRSGPFTM